MRITKARLDQTLAEDPKAIAQAFARVLRDFGYPVDAAYVGNEIKRLQNGEAAKGGPSMFIKNWLDKGIED